MKNINNIVSYMRRRSEELKGVSMVIPTSVMMWDHIADILESYGWKTGFPERDGRYVCLCYNDDVHILPYSKEYDSFICHDEWYAPFKVDVIAWCELPELPEELKK